MVPPSVAAAMASSQFKSLQASIAMSTSVRPSFPVLDTVNTVVDTAIVRDLLDANLQIVNLLKQTPFYLTTTTTTNTASTDGIERYSDKYEKRPKKDKLTSLPCPHHLFPEELVSTTPTHPTRQFSFHSAMAKLQQAERDGDQDKEEDEEKQDEDEGVLDEEVYEEEELEDETDYNLSYFDNGEDVNYEDGGGGEDGEPSY